MDDFHQEFEDLFHYAFGFDWGTSYSLMAAKNHTQPPAVPNYSPENRNGVPSLFYRDAEGREYCAEKAKGPGRADPANLCRSVKMKLDGEDIVLNGHSYAPKEIAVKLVRSILQSSQKAFEEDYIDFDPASAQLVCGVPVRFNAAKRGQVREIMLEATGAASVRLVSEPILAAVAYNYFMKRQTAQPILCFDVGAGTSDFCVLRRTVNGPEPYEVCPGADGLLVAGDRLDEITAELILEKLRQNPGALDPAVFTDPGRRADHSHLLDQAREMKEALSDNEFNTMPITTADGSRSGSVTVTRAEFEERIRPLITEMADMAEQVLHAAGLGEKPDIRIQLMGGSCYIPLIRQLLQERFSWVQNIELRKPQQMVALGAALYAEMPAMLQPKVAFGYAVGTHHSNREVLDVRIPSDAKLPSIIQGYYATRYDNQTCVTFHIYEVDHGSVGEYLDPEQGRKMGGDYFINHDFQRPVPKGTTVLLTTELNTDGVLTMKVDDIDVTGEVTSKTFTLANTGTV